MEDKILKIAREVFQEDSLVLSSIIGDAEACDSLNIIQFSMTLENDIGVVFEDGEIDETRTIQEIVDMAKARV